MSTGLIRFFYRLDLGNKNVSRKFQFAGMTRGSLWGWMTPFSGQKLFTRKCPIRTWCPIFTPDEPWKKPGVPYVPSNPDCLIEILMMVYHNSPKKHGQFNPLLYTLNNHQGPFFLCSDGFPTTGILKFLEFATSIFWRKMPQVFINEGKQHISISLSLCLSLSAMCTCEVKIYTPFQ